MTNNNFIIAIVYSFAAAFSLQSFAGLKETLLAIGDPNDTQDKVALVEDALTVWSKEAAQASTFDLSFDHYEAFFSIALSSEAIQELSTFAFPSLYCHLLDGAMRLYGTRDDAPALPHTLKMMGNAIADSLGEREFGEEVVVPFITSETSARGMAKFVSASFKEIMSDASTFNLFVDYLSTDAAYRAEIFEAIIGHKDFARVAPIIGFADGDEQSIDLVQQKFFKYLLERKEDWVSQATLLLTVIERDKDMSEWCDSFTAIAKDHILQKIEKGSHRKALVNMLPLVEARRNSRAVGVQWDILEKIHTIPHDELKEMLGLNASKFWKGLLQLKPLNDAFEKMQEEVMKHEMPYLYDFHFRRASEFIYSDLPELENGPSLLSLINAEIPKVICNQNGYDKGVNISCTLGKPLTLHDGSPIGYNVHLPKGEIVAVLFHAYGGHQVSDRLKKMYRPGNISPLDKYLLMNGIAVVTLNTLDLLELKVPQNQMPDDIHDRIQESIHASYEALRAGTLHDDLAVLKELPYFLFGASFGGFVAAKHAQTKKYEGTFRGYLSFDPSVDWDVRHKTRGQVVLSFDSEGKVEARGRLDPALHIADLSAPLLLVHNFDDNNVNVLTSLSYFKKALAVGKKDLIRILLMPKGATLSKTKDKPHNKGHFPRYLTSYIRRLGDHMTRFMKQGPSAIPAAGMLSAHVHELQAYRNFKDASAGERFISVAYRHYLSQPKEITDQVWNEEYLPLFAANYFVEDVSKPERIISAIDDLRKSGQLTDEVWSRSVSSHAAFFAEYIKEVNWWLVPYKSVMNAILESADARKTFAKNVENLDAKSLTFYSSRFILRELFLANPTLAAITDEVIEQAALARVQFENLLAEEQTLALLAAKDAIALAPTAMKKNYEEIVRMMNELSARKPARADVFSYSALLRKTDGCLHDLAKNLHIKSHYRNLIEALATYKDVDVDCARAYAQALVSLALIVGNKDFMEQSLIDAAAPLVRVNCGSLDEVLINNILEPLMKELSPRNSHFTDDDVIRWKTLVQEVSQG